MVNGPLLRTDFTTLLPMLSSRGGGWAFEYDRGADGDQYKLEELNAAEIQLLGRVTRTVGPDGVLVQNLGAIRIEQR